MRRPRPRRRIAGVHQAVQNGKGERGRLARAGLCAAEQVAAGKDVGNGLGLDGGGGGVAFAVNGAEEGLGEPKIFEKS